MYIPAMKSKPVEVSVEGVQVDGLDALLEAGRKLQQLDPKRFERVLALCRTYVSIYERPGEADEAGYRTDPRRRPPSVR